MISRRIFLKDGALALVSLGFAPTFLARTVEGLGGQRQKILITIFQRGAVDGLNMIIPFGEPDYYASRPSLAIAKPGSDDNTAVDLNGFFGMHPRMRPLKPLWESGHTGDRPRLRLSRRDALSLRRAGLHGVGARRA